VDVGDDLQPSNAELAWRLERIQDTLNGVIGRPEYLSDKQALDYRFTEVKGHIDDLRRVHADDVRELHARITEQAKTGVEHRYHWRTMLLTGVLPALATIAGIVATIIISRGGK
jgi:hypothetical protein